MKLKITPIRCEGHPYMVRIACENINKLPNYAACKVDRAVFSFLLITTLPTMAQFVALCLLTSTMRLWSNSRVLRNVVLFMDMVAGDIFLYIVPEHRSLLNATLLLKAYTDWATARGAKLIQATHTGGLNDRGMALLLEL